ncbi:MAG: hypothetical protein RBT75_07275 [Anaerolineae bacterium]|jgi:hypothetical protein|nr:hypothetical protein [Anaerolineae bacterium]
MMSKITIALVVVLAVALVAGMGYIILRPETATARGGGQSHVTQANTTVVERGGAYGQRQAAAGTEHSLANTTRGGGYGQGQNLAGAESSQVAARGGGYGQANAGAATLSRNANIAVEHAVAEMETIQGVVISSDSEILVRTAEGEEVLVVLGQAWYREQAGFTVAVGDEVSVVGFYEDGEFKAVTVEDLTTGATITLRDASGRPAWSGQGNRRNSNL